MKKKVITPVLIDITGIIKKHNCEILHEIDQRHKLQNSLTEIDSINMPVSVKETKSIIEPKRNISLIDFTNLGKNEILSLKKYTVDKIKINHVG